MWGTSSPEDKLTGDLGNVIEATSVGGRRSNFFTAGKLVPGNLGLLQHYLPGADICSAANGVLLDHLVGASEQNGRHVKADSFGSLEIDHQLEMRRLLDRYVLGLCPLQYCVSNLRRTRE
jgi:hypothetical protein